MILQNWNWSSTWSQTTQAEKPNETPFLYCHNRKFRTNWTRIKHII